MSSVLLGLVAALIWGVHDFVARFPSRAIGPVPTVLIVTLAGFVFITLWLVASGDTVRIAWPQLWVPAVSGISLAIAALSMFAAPLVPSPSSL